MSFKEGVKRKGRLCFVGKENRKESDKQKHFHVSVRKQVFERSQEEAKGRARKRESIYFCCRIRWIEVRVG